VRRPVSNGTAKVLWYVGNAPPTEAGLCSGLVVHCGPGRSHFRIACHCRIAAARTLGEGARSCNHMSLRDGSRNDVTEGPTMACGMSLRLQGPAMPPAIPVPPAMMVPPAMTPAMPGRACLRTLSPPPLSLPQKLAGFCHVLYLPVSRGVFTVPLLTSLRITQTFWVCSPVW
jgi:hypothetical protein